jgi:hypothetical protein
MATLTIGDKQVQVSDDFLKLSPEQQHATVDEIAKQLGPQPQSAPQAPAQQPQSIGDMLSAGFTSGVKALPFVGPTVLGGLENLKGMVQGRSAQDVAATDQAQVEANPTASTVGNVAGTVAPFAIGGEIPAVAKLLGMDSTVPLLWRSLAGLGSNAAISGGDALVRGASPQQAAQDALIGGTIGAAIPGAGDLLGKGAAMLGKRIAPTIDALRNPQIAGQKMISGAAARDLKAGNAMTVADEATAALNGQPIVNADRFGEGVRTLARTAGNSDPAAGEALKSLTEDRFLTQAPRAAAFVKRITGGATDDLALQNTIQQAARNSNSAAYGKAYMSPGAQMVWTPEIKQLFQSPDFIAAVHGAERTAANDAASSGVKAVKSPFAFDAKGNISIRTNPDGSKAVPNLQFWDIVQRNLRAGSDKAYRAGDNLLGSQLSEMRKQLVGSLDNAVPAFATARKGAAAAFGAEDALDAGRKFVGQPMGIPEAKAAYAKFTPAEQKAFGVGYASSLIDKINAARDRVNVINQVFGSPAARSQVELALGKNAAAQLEHFVRIEDIMQQTKNAVQGNSSTAKQLAAMGALGGLGGGILGGWDPRNMATGAGLMMAGRLGARALGKAVDQKVMQHVADVLASHDPAAVNRVILNATMSPQHSNAIKAIQLGLKSVARGIATTATRPQPTQITVNGGNAMAPAY